MDYSILMTTRYHEERAFGRTPKEAAQQSLEHCSQSILTSGLTFFAATVGVAAISKMELLKSICLLISRGALISMVVILVMLPAALMLCDWIIRHTTLKWMVPESANAKKSERSNYVMKNRFVSPVRRWLSPSPQAVQCPHLQLVRAAFPNPRPSML